MLAELKNEFLSIAVKSLGAELSSIKDNSDQMEYLWQGDPAYWPGQSPLLFPIIGGLPGGKYELDGKTYEMPGHGFAKRSEFELVEGEPGCLCFHLRDNELTRDEYPFKFELLVRYSLDGRTVRVAYEVRNLDQREMLFSIGGHPGFHCPMFPGETMEDYVIAFEKKETATRRFKSDGLLDGRKELFLKDEREFKLSHRLFADGAVILGGLASKWVELKNTKTGKAIRVGIEGFPYLGFWSQTNDAPFVCIEPWYGVDSAHGDSGDFRTKEGMRSLQPGRTFRCEYGITIM